MLGADLHSALFPQYQRRRTDTPDATLQPIGDERTYFVDAMASVFGHDLAYAADAAGARTSTSLLATPHGHRSGERAGGSPITDISETTPTAAGAVGASASPLD